MERGRKREEERRGEGERGEKTRRGREEGGRERQRKNEMRWKGIKVACVGIYNN